MQLTSELLAQIVGHRTVKFGGFRKREKRNVARLNMSWRINVVPVRAGKLHAPQTVKLREVSNLGLSLLAHGDYRTGDLFLISLPRLSGPAIWIECSVVRSHRVDAQCQIVGVRFNRVHDKSSASPKPAHRSRLRQSDHNATNWN